MLSLWATDMAPCYPHGVLKLALIASLLLSVVVLPASAAMALEDFDDDAFVAARSADKAIILDFAASWCVVCKVQELIFRRAEFSERCLIVFTIDFDKNAALKRRFGVSYPATLIVIRGKQEIGRLVGEARTQSIMRLIKKSL